MVEGVLEDDRRTITYACDRSGRRTAEEHSDGRRREYEWTGLWTLSAITDHSGDTVARTTTVVDALGQLTRVNDEEVFFDDLTGRLLQAGGQTITHAGPLTATVPGGWLEPSWRPGRDTDPQNPYQPPAAQTMRAAASDSDPAARPASPAPNGSEPAFTTPPAAGSCHRQPRVRSHNPLDHLRAGRLFVLCGTPHAGPPATT